MKRTKEQFRAEHEAFREELYRQNIHWEERERLDRQFYADWYNEMEVGDRCHIQHYSDVSPCTVIKRTKKTITVRYDKATRDPNWKPEFIPGGFSVICTNNEEQRWIIEEDLEGRTETFRLHNNGKFESPYGERLYPEWLMHYDYNF